MATKFKLNLDHRSSTSIGRNAGVLPDMNTTTMLSSSSPELKAQAAKDRGPMEVASEAHREDGSEPYGKFYLARVLGEFPIDSSGRAPTPFPLYYLHWKEVMHRWYSIAK